MVLNRKWTHEMFVDYVKNESGDSFEVRGEYKGNQSNILMYHNECGREFTIRPGNFKTRKRCSLCYRNFKKTTMQFAEEVRAVVNNEYSIIGEYTQARENIEFRHNVCGNHYKATPDDFLNGGNRCPMCAPNRKKTTNEFKHEVNETSNGEYILIGEYVGSKELTEFKHKTCGLVFEKSPELFLIGIRCPDCGLTKRSGENHYKYNFDLTENDRLKRDMFNGEIRKWRTRVYERDNYTCKICNKLGGKLNAHHIFSWDKYMSLRFDTNNGVTLCENCHRSFHSSCGYGNNDMTQFKIYSASLK